MSKITVEEASADAIIDHLRAAALTADPEPCEAERRAAARLYRDMAALGGPHASRFARLARFVEDEAALLALTDLDPSADVCGWSAVAALAGEAP